jgi:hypothetical protein
VVKNDDTLKHVLSDFYHDQDYTQTILTLDDSLYCIPPVTLPQLLDPHIIPDTIKKKILKNKNTRYYYARVYSDQCDLKVVKVILYPVRKDHFASAMLIEGNVWGEYKYQQDTYTRLACQAKMF